MRVEQEEVSACPARVGGREWKRTHVVVDKLGEDLVEVGEELDHVCADLRAPGKLQSQ